MATTEDRGRKLVTEENAQPSEVSSLSSLSDSDDDSSDSSNDESESSHDRPMHRIFEVYDIVAMIADQTGDNYLDNEGDEGVSLVGVTAARRAALQSLRLVNRAFASAAARPLFREWYIDGHEDGNRRLHGPYHQQNPRDTFAGSRRVPRNFVQFEQFSALPLAKHVRVFELECVDRAMVPWGGTVDNSLSWDIRDVVGPDDPLVKDKQFDNTTDGLQKLFESWIVSRLKRFSNVRHLAVRDWGHALSRALNIAAQAGLPHLRSLAMESFDGMSAAVDESDFETGALVTMYSKLNEFKWFAPECRSELRIDRVVSRQLRVIENLKYLDLTRWPLVLDPPQGHGFSDRAITKHKTLRVLRLTDLHISAEALCDILVANKDTLQEVHLSQVELRAGYWHTILNQLGTMLAKLVKLELNKLSHCHAGTPMVPLTMTFKLDVHTNPLQGDVSRRARRMSDKMDIFGPMETLNTDDRKAYMSLVAQGGYHFAKNDSMPLGSRSQLVAEYARCAGAIKNTTLGKRCRRFADTIRNESTGLWTYKDHRGMTTDNIWFCRSHVGQAAGRAQVWPWEEKAPDNIGP